MSKTQPTSFSVIHNINYTTENYVNVNGVQKYSLDLYLPGNTSKLSAKPPIVIFIHGGGWRRGDRICWKHMISSFDTNLLFALIFRYFNLYSNVGSYFSKNGIACAVISYPLCFLKFPYYIFEMLTSILASFFIVVTLIFLTGKLVMGIFGYPFWITEIYLVELIGIYQVIIWIIVSLNLLNYPKLTKTVMLLPWIFSAIAFFCVFFVYMDPLSTRIVSLIVFAISWQSIMFTQYFCHSRETTNYVDQIKAVAQSVKWIKKYGEETEMYNICCLFLCGHSAGGHLASLLAFNQQILSQHGINQSDIKGIMAISAIYNLCVLNHFLLRQLYLIPAFGNHFTNWQQASPLYNIISHKNIPSFLIISAEFDPFLKEDALQFVKKLKSKNISCNYTEIRRINHYTIIFASETLAKCVEFVKKKLSSP